MVDGGRILYTFSMYIEAFGAPKLWKMYQCTRQNTILKIEMHSCFIHITGNLRQKR